MIYLACPYSHADRKVEVLEPGGEVRPPQIPFNLFDGPGPK